MTDTCMQLPCNCLCSTRYLTLNTLYTICTLEMLYTYIFISTFNVMLDFLLLQACDNLRIDLLAHILAYACKH